MKTIFAALFLASSLVSACAAQAQTSPDAPMSDKERVDYLIKQNQMLMEENAKLKELSNRPRTKEEAFALCMQAAKGGNSAMAAESIGGHCDQLLKR